MFGLFRLILATLVAATHIGKLHGAAGGYAVFSFYMLSGYLMTLVLTTIYVNGVNAIVLFYINRMLRIFPSLLAVAAITVLFLYFVPHYKSPPFETMNLPDSLSGWVSTLTLIDYIGLNGQIPTQLSRMLIIPVAWSLSVECLFYLLMPLLARNQRVAVAWFALSLMYTLCAVMNHYPYALRYNSPLAASLPFSLGSVLYHYCFGRISRVPGTAILAVATLCIMHATLRHYIHAILGLYYKDPMLTGLYVAVALSSVMIVLLGAYSPQNDLLRHLDRISGSLSYPVFLCHYIVGLSVLAVFPTIRPQSNVHLFISLPIVYAAAYLCVAYVEQPIMRFRDTIRRNAARNKVVIFYSQ